MFLANVAPKLAPVAPLRAWASEVVTLLISLVSAAPAVAVTETVPMTFTRVSRR